MPERHSLKWSFHHSLGDDVLDLGCLAGVVGLNLNTGTVKVVDSRIPSASCIAVVVSDFPPEFILVCFVDEDGLSGVKPLVLSLKSDPEGTIVGV